MSELVPGFRFYPTEEELISFYLFHKLRAQRQDIDLVIPVVDVYRHEPWQLPGESGTLCRGDMEQWFFFVPRQEREAHGGRPTRITPAGYWKATGSPSYVYSTDNRVIGLKKTMVFYKGRCPNVQKTKWKMNEYKAIQEERATAADESSDAVVPKVRYEYSLCRVYVVSGNFRAFNRRPQAAAATRNLNTHSHASGGAQGEHNASIDESRQTKGTSYDQSSASAIKTDTEWRLVTTDWGQQMMNN